MIDTAPQDRRPDVRPRPSARRFATAHQRWEEQPLEELVRALRAIRADALGLERGFAEELRDAHRSFSASARNLVHYLALRRHDIRGLQEQLASLGLSSLGRTESHVLAGIDAVLGILHQLVGRPWLEPPLAAPAITFAEGDALLAEHTAALLGPPPRGRGVRVMVTMPGEAARDYGLIRQLLANGMDCMRINCAHDDARAWKRMIDHLHRARRELGRPCRILMDVAGPKLRTGEIDARSQTLRWKPQRDRFGAVVTPARIWVTAATHPSPPPNGADGCLRAQGNWLTRARAGERLTFEDLRGKSRRLTLMAAARGGRWASADQTAYLGLGRPLQLRRVVKKAGRKAASRAVEAIPFAVSADRHYLTLKPGDALLLTRAPVPGRPAVIDASGHQVRSATISCTLAADVFADLRTGERLWFGDGRLGGGIQP